MNIPRVGFSYNLLLFTKMQKLKENTTRIKYYELRMEQSDGRSSGDGVNSGADLQLTILNLSHPSPQIYQIYPIFLFKSSHPTF